MSEVFTVNSLQQLLGKEDKFFDLFEASTAECSRSAKAVSKLAENPAERASLEELAQARRKDKAIHAEISEALCSSVVTALDREDILALAESLYRIPKTAEKIGERILLAPGFLEGLDLSPQVRLLVQATDTLLQMVQALRQRANLSKMRDLNNQMQQVEADADGLVLILLKGLYNSEMEGRRVVFLKDLFELFEKATDRCRDAGNTIVHMVLKST